MEPKKKIKKFDEFTQSNHPRGIFNHEIYKTTQSLRRVMELPMGDVLGLLRVDAEKPQMLREKISKPIGMSEEDFPRTIMGRTTLQPIRIRFRDGINVSEIELQNSIWDWVYNNDYSKENICIKTLDPTGVEIERWSLRGCFPTQISYHPIGENDEQQYLELTLHYDYFTINS
tara:strand:- start:292 stop:810 length:519 start_codon:yes stop_codon:yes gene_type:complete